MFVFLHVRLSSHFGLWSANGWSDRDGRIFARCAGTVEKRWCQLRADQLRVALATCNLAKSCKNIVRPAAGQKKKTDSAQTWWNDYKHAEDSIHFGVDGGAPFTHVRGLLNSKYRVEKK